MWRLQTRQQEFQSRNRETFDSNLLVAWLGWTSTYLFQSRNRETFDSNYQKKHVLMPARMSFNLVIEKLLIPTV